MNLPSREQQQLFERQNRVYEVLDVATKPAQWLIGGLKLLFLAVVLTGIAIGTPIYVLCSGGHVTFLQISHAVIALSGMVLLFFCPWYVVLGGTSFAACFGWWLFEHPNQTAFQSPEAVLFGFIVFGYAQYVLRLALKSHKERQQTYTEVPEHEVSGRVPLLKGEEMLTLDSPLPEDLKQSLKQKLQSITDEMESLLESERERRISEIEAMPLQTALETANAMIADVFKRSADSLERMQRGEYTTDAEASKAVRRLLAMSEEVCGLLSAMIARFKRKAPHLLVSDFEAVLAELRDTTEKIENVAESKGFI